MNRLRKVLFYSPKSFYLKIPIEVFQVAFNLHEFSYIIQSVTRAPLVYTTDIRKINWTLAVNFDVTYECHIIICWKYILWTFWGFLMTVICDIKIDLIMWEPQFFLWISSIVKLFNFLIHDMFMVMWWESNVFHLVVDVFSEFSKYIIEHVEVEKYLPRGMLMVNFLYIFLPPK